MTARPYRDLSDDELEAWRADIIYGMARSLDQGEPMISDTRDRILTLIFAELRARGHGVIE